MIKNTVWTDDAIKVFLNCYRSKVRSIFEHAGRDACLDELLEKLAKPESLQNSLEEPAKVTPGYAYVTQKQRTLDAMRKNTRLLGYGHALTNRPVDTQLDPGVVHELLVEALHQLGLRRYCQKFKYDLTVGQLAEAVGITEGKLRGELRNERRLARNSQDQVLDLVEQMARRREYPDEVCDAIQERITALLPKP